MDDRVDVGLQGFGLDQRALRNGMEARIVGGVVDLAFMSSH
jgi:hypothetical protein